MGHERVRHGRLRISVRALSAPRGRCLEVGSTFPLGERRTVLLQMAQVWQRLADDYQGSTPPLIRPDAGASPTLQQQQQCQPKDEDEKPSE